MRLPLILALTLAVAGCATAPKLAEAEGRTARVAAVAETPAMRWGQRKGGDAWTAQLMTALEREGVGLTSNVPRDIATFCPGYAQQPPEGRRAFWAGLLSAVARHESSFNPGARGGGGRYLGLMQISPATWRQYGCSGEMLNGGHNLSCAAKIAARQVARDGAVVGGKGGWRGVARDWMPLRNGAKRGEIAAWTRSQPYCAGA